MDLPASGRVVCDTGCPPSLPQTPATADRRVVLESPQHQDKPRDVLVQDVPPSELSAKLVAAKPITWRGRGDLVQVTWAPVLRGSWLVLDLWSGVGGLCIALLQMGMHFYGVSAEMDAQARAVASSNMPSLVHCDRVETLRALGSFPTSSSSSWYSPWWGVSVPGKLQSQQAAFGIE